VRAVNPERAAIDELDFPSDVELVPHGVAARNPLGCR
jgi:hypothetical protein